MRKLEKKYLRNGLKINFVKTEYDAIWEVAMKDLKVDEESEIKGTHQFKYLEFITAKN